MNPRDIAVGLARDPAFKALSPDRQKVVFDSAVQKAGASPPAADPMVGRFGQVPQSAYDRGERNVMGNVFERPAAAMRGFVQGMAPGGPGPIENYQRGAVNPGLIPTFQDTLLDQHYQDRAMRHPGQDAGLEDKMAGFLPSTVGFAADQVTNPASLLTGMVAPMAMQAFQNTKLGQAAGQVMNADIPLPQFGRPKVVAPKTLPEVAAIPETEIHLHPPKIQNQYFKMKRDVMAQEVKARGRGLKEERKLLNRELGKAAQQRSLEIREQLPALYSRQSQQYRELFEADLQGRAHLKLPEEKMKAYLLKRYGQDPERLNAISGRLGLVDDPPTEAIKTSNLVNEFGKPITTVEQLPKPTRTVGELYQQAKEMGQALPSSVRQSLRTHTPEEDLIDETIDSITGFLAESGVDFSNSRQFWAEWKPIQQQATVEFRPYNRVDTRTQAASSRIKKVAMGMDPDNVVYAKTLSDYLGIDDLPGDVKRVVAKLGANQKALLANQIEKEALNSPQSAMANQKFVAGTRHEAQMEKLNRVKATLDFLLRGSAVYGGYSVIRDQVGGR